MKRALIVLFILIFLFGCAKEQAQLPETDELEPVETDVEGFETVEPDEVMPPSEKGILSLLVSDQDNVISSFDSLDVTFNLVKIYKPQSSEAIEKNINVLADLTALQNDHALEILEMQLEAGPYNKIKLYISDAKGVIAGNDVEILLPGDALVFERPFNIDNGETVTFLADIEALETKKISVFSRLPKYELSAVTLKSGLTSPSLLNIMTAAEMKALINAREEKRFDRTILMTQADGFTPAEITIKTGTKVVWKNNDEKKLGVILDGVFDQFIRADGSYEHTFNRVGSFPYVMKYYISNKGRIDVILADEAVEEEIISQPKRTVDIMDYGFSPATLTISRGTEVTFVNKDIKNHFITIGFGFDRYELAPSKSFSYTYNDLGEFTFHDAYDVGTYAGKIIVGR
ncbi:MAG: DUF4382 domain-containing protein [Nanoarchaeota archaeon]|nr:DUF4382 domain-containing protein [Nanoarchaeota archaeon]